LQLFIFRARLNQVAESETGQKGFPGQALPTGYIAGVFFSLKPLLGELYALKVIELTAILLG
jgi:hypothetical protein